MGSYGPWITPLPRALKSAKEKEPVLDDPAAGDAAELVALQRVALWRGRLPGIELVVAEKIKKVAMETIAARFGNDVHNATRMQSVLRRQRAGLDAEFLNRVRERNWKIHIAEGVIVVAAIQQIADAVGLAACHCKRARTVGSLHVLAASQIAGRGRGASTGERQQLRKVSTIERKFYDSALLDYLRNCVLLGLDHSRIGCDLNAFRDSADLQHNRDVDIVRDL